MNKAISKLSLMPHTWQIAPCVYPLEKLSNRGWYKINIWKTEGMLELGSWSEHTATATENLLSPLQNAFSDTSALAHETTTLKTSCELLPALQRLWGWSGWVVPTHTLHVQGFTRLQLGSFAVVTLNTTHNDRKYLLSSPDQRVQPLQSVVGASFPECCAKTIR